MCWLLNELNELNVLIVVLNHPTTCFCKELGICTQASWMLSDSENLSACTTLLNPCAV